MKKRIEYIDVAKGICMLLIVASHVNIPDPWPGAYTVRVLLFFVLSGFFFSAKSNISDFLKKKARTLLVPFLIFWVISYALFYLGNAFVPGFSSLTKANGMFDCFYQKEYFNGPLWFLLALMFVQLFSYAIERYIPNAFAKICVYLLGGLAGFELGSHNMDLPLNIDTALTTLPFFAVGMRMKQYNMLESIPNLWVKIIGVVALYYIYLHNVIGVEMALNRYDNSFADLIMMGVILSVIYVIISQIVSYKRNYISSFLKYIGVNSMYIMCIHHLVYRPVKLAMKVVGDIPYTNIIIFVITVAFCAATAPIVNRYLPIIIGKQTSKK